MSQNTNKETQAYYNAIGKFFPHMRLDLTFTHSDLKEKHIEIERSVLDYYRKWIDTRKGVLLVKEALVHIDGHYATVFSITMESNNQVKIFEKMLEITNAYCDVFGCAVIWESMPLFSSVQSKVI